MKVHVGTYVRHAALAGQLYGEAKSAAELRSRFEFERGQFWTNVVLLNPKRRPDNSVWSSLEKSFREQDKR